MLSRTLRRRFRLLVSQRQGFSHLCRHRKQVRAFRWKAGVFALAVAVGSYTAVQVLGTSSVSTVHSGVHVALVDGRGALPVGAVGDGGALPAFGRSAAPAASRKTAHTTSKRKVSKARISDEVREYFRGYDSDDSGAIRLSEFRQWHAELSTSEVRGFFREVDFNRDGKIDIQEFATNAAFDEDEFT